MIANPALKPKVATAGLTLTSVAVLIGAAVFSAPVADTAGLVNPFVASVWLLIFAAAASTTIVWLVRLRRRRAWILAAKAKWSQFQVEKQRHGTTTEVTVLSVDALEPTGSWITIRWNRFDHIQPAWIEVLSEPIWPGSVLLISPDPRQVVPGVPWPPTYALQATGILAWAPAEDAGRRSRFNAPLMRLPE